MLGCTMDMEDSTAHQTRRTASKRAVRRRTDAPRSIGNILSGGLRAPAKSDGVTQLLCSGAPSVNFLRCVRPTGRLTGWTDGLD